MASVNSGAKEKAIKSMIDDVFKEFKTSGDFDRFRKEYFVEITSLNSFQNLSKNIDEYIQKLLEEQLRIHHHPSALRKNDLRELVRRRLQENYSFNQQINMYINQIIESKIEGNLKPIISADVDKLTKTNETSGGVSSNDSANASSQNTDNTQDHSQNTTSSDSKSAASLVQQRKVSIEDFLCIGEANKSNSSQPVTTVSTPPGSNLQQLKSSATTKLAESKPKSSADSVLERQKSLPNKADINESSIKKEKATIEEKKPSQNVVKSEPKSSTNKPIESQKPAQNLKKPSTTTTATTTSASSYEFMRKLSFINEAKLQADPKKHYNFDWKLDQIPDDESFLETISVSSVDTSENSDEEENNSNDSKTE